VDYLIVNWEEAQRVCRCHHQGQHYLLHVSKKFVLEEGSSFYVNAITSRLIVVGYSIEKESNKDEIVKFI
jgi:hypothetical protein